MSYNASLRHTQKRLAIGPQEPTKYLNRKPVHLSFFQHHTLLWSQTPLLEPRLQQSTSSKRHNTTGDPDCSNQLSATRKSSDAPVFDANTYLSRHTGSGCNSSGPCSCLFELLQVFGVTSRGSWTLVRGGFRTT